MRQCCGESTPQENIGSKYPLIVLLVVLLFTFPILLLLLPIIALPVAFVWYLVVGGIYAARKGIVNNMKNKCEKEAFREQVSVREEKNHNFRKVEPIKCSGKS
jgi:uncharacterized membrane protein